MIERKDVEYIANLARLSLSEGEKDSFARQLSTILDYIDTLNSVDTANVEPTAFVVAGHNPLREDVERPSLPVDELLANGPSVKKGHFAIPKVIG
jgi:aspartyl-tRNA(Asn)/glutamyl-tRNA(Gln) amidotransferase subunit C